MGKEQQLISIIVPVYKVEKYLEKCINSILTQTMEQFELILVDDGSPDNSGKICDEYAQKDVRVKVIHKENGGLSDARNVGIQNAKGKYITFIDSDDYIDEKYLEILTTIIEKERADIVICGMVNFKEGEDPQSIDSDKYEVINRGTAYRKMLLQEDIDISANAKIYKRDIFKEVKYPVGELYEDMKIIDKVIDKCEKIIYTKYKGYFYLQRSGSIMYSKMSDEKLTLISASEKLLLKMKQEYPENEEVAIKRYIFCNFHLLGRAILDKEYSEKCRKLRENILKYKKEIFQSKLYSHKEKIATCILSLNLTFFKAFWIIYCRLIQKKMS